MKTNGLVAGLPNAFAVPLVATDAAEHVLRVAGDVSNNAASMYNSWLKLWSDYTADMTALLRHFWEVQWSFIDKAIDHIQEDLPGKLFERKTVPR